MTNIDAQRIKEIRNNTKEMTYYIKSIAKSFERIADALESKADTPQTDCDKCIWNVCNYNKVEWDADTPQTEAPKQIRTPYEGDITVAPQTEETEAERLDRIDNEIEDAWARIKELTPQTDCSWK